MCYKCTEGMTECVMYTNPDKCKWFEDGECQHCEWFQCEDKYNNRIINKQTNKQNTRIKNE